VREVGRQLLHRPIEPREGVVVFAVRRLAFRLERREIVGSGHDYRSDIRRARDRR